MLLILTLGKKPFESHEEFLFLQPMIMFPPKHYDIFFPLLLGECSESLDALIFVFNNDKTVGSYNSGHVMCC